MKSEPVFKAVISIRSVRRRNECRSLSLMVRNAVNSGTSTRLALPGGPIMSPLHLRPSISAGRRTVLRESMACRVTSCGSYGLYGVSIRTVTSCFCPSGKRLFRSTALRSLWNGLVRPLGCHFRSMLTCCGMLLATPWRPVESIQGHCRPSWDTARSRTSSSTHPSRISGFAIILQCTLVEAV